MDDLVNICLRPMGDGHCVDLIGELSVATFLKMRQQLYAYIDSGCKYLAINLNPVTFMDTTAIAILVGALRRVRECNGRLIIICNNAHHIRTLNMTNIDRIIEVVPSEAEARAMLQSRPSTHRPA